jgi:hypothetical protein
LAKIFLKSKHRYLDLDVFADPNERDLRVSDGDLGLHGEDGEDGRDVGANEDPGLELGQL